MDLQDAGLLLLMSLPTWAVTAAALISLLFAGA